MPILYFDADYVYENTVVLLPIFPSPWGNYERRGENSMLYWSNNDSWGAFHQAFCQCFSLTTVISYWNPCIWLAESKFVSEKHWQNAWWNAPLVTILNVLQVLRFQEFIFKWFCLKIMLIRMKIATQVAQNKGTLLASFPIVCYTKKTMHSTWQVRLKPFSLTCVL